MALTEAAFVGRGRSFGELQQRLRGAREDGGRVVLVTGEAGIGKTRLCQEVARRHREKGGQVVVGRAFPEDVSVAFGPVADALRTARRAGAPLWVAASERAEVVAAVLPELSTGAHRRERLDRPVLFEALLDAIEQAAGEAPSLWVLEDLHWADDSTWGFVKYAVRRVAHLPLVLVATYREEEVGPAHAWWPKLAWLRREGDVVSLHLDRLANADASLLVRSVAPSLSDRMVGEVVTRSAGTPLFLEELALLARSGEDLPQVPDIARATVLERAAHLGPAAELFQVAAVAGLEVDLGLLASLRPHHPLAPLVSSGLFESSEGRLRFRHPLLQEAAYELVPAARRRDLHTEWARTLEKDGQAVERAATHFERAGQAAEALRTLQTASDRAQGGGDVGRAATLSLAAFALAHRRAALASHRETTMARAISDLFRAGRWSELDPLVRQAWTEREVLAPDNRVWLAGVLAVHLFWSGAISEAHAVVASQVRHLGAASPDRAAMLLAQGAFIAWFSGDRPGAVSHAERALELARSAGDLEAECRARNGLVNARYQPGRDRLWAAEEHRRTAALARAHGLTAAEANARWSLSHFTTTIEDYEAAERAARRAGSWYAAPASLLKGSLHLMEGRADEAERLFVAIGPRIRLGIPAVAPWMDVKEAGLFLHRGDLDQARALLLARESSAAARLAFWRADRSATHGWLAWEEQAWESAAEHLAASMTQWPYGAYHTLVGGPILLPLHVDALLRMDRLHDAVAVVASAVELGSDPDRFFTAALAAARFRLHPSPDAGEEAQRLAAAAPWPWLDGTTAAWRAELLGDVEAARAAVRTFERIGASRAAARAEAVQRHIGGPMARPESPSPSLSPREFEVARLIAEGLSNPAIARRLYLSRPTVASHVAHILTKLGFSSRSQIAAWVATRGPSPC